MRPRKPAFAPAATRPPTRWRRSWTKTYFLTRRFTSQEKTLSDIWVGDCKRAVAGGPLDPARERVFTHEVKNNRSNRRVSLGFYTFCGGPHRASVLQMRFSDSRARVGCCVVALAVISGAAVLSSATRKSAFTPRDKAYYADQNTINFVRPGLIITIVSAKIAADGTLTVDYKLTDADGLGLDRLGVATPGAISPSFLIDYIAKGQTQFTSYVTRARTSTDGKITVTQATTDSGGVQTQVAIGEYIYTYAAKVPATYDPTATHRVGIYGSRNLTEFDLGTNYASTVFY